MIIYFKGVAYNLPIQKGYKLNRAIDSTFDSGVVTTSPLTNDYGDLDISRRIPRDLLVEIERDGHTFRFRTAETSMTQVSYGNIKQYEHTINLISEVKWFTRMPLENMKVTQPQGDLGTYIRSVNRIDITEKDTLSSYYPSVQSKYGSSSVYKVYNQTTIPYENLLSTNTSKIDGMEIISLQEYKVSLNIYLFYLDAFQDTLNYTINLYYGGSIIKSVSYDLLKTGINNDNSSTPFIISDTITFNFTPTSSQTFSVVVGNDDFVYFNTLSLSITATEVINKPIRTYAQLVSKVLRHQPYVLNAYSRDRLNITAPEHKFENYTIYDALDKIGTENGALLRVYDEINERYWQKTASTTPDLTGDSVQDFNPYDYEIGTVLLVGTKYYKVAETSNLVREIGYEFFDNPSVVDLNYQLRSEKAELEDYVSAVDLATNNVISPLRYSPYKNGWKGVRTTDISQQTTDNIVYEFEDMCEKPINVYVKGRSGRNIANTVTYSESDITNISSQVVNEILYRTLSNEKNTSYTGKQVLRKHNTIYYTQGGKYLNGLTYLGEDLSVVVGTAEYKRAIYEAIDTARSLESGELIYHDTVDDEGIAGDLKLQFYVEYQPITESHARVYKDDQTGFERDLIKYINESSNINESDAIGNYAQLVVNRLGGTKIIYTGQVDTYDELPNLGDKDSDGNVYTVMDLTFGKKITYTITCVEGYNIISSYIGIKSRLRIEEVSSSDTTNRYLRYTSKFIFTENEETFSTRLIDPSKILASLYGTETLGVNYAYVEFNHENGDSVTVHGSVHSVSKGKTINLIVDMKDNYSAGLQRYMRTISGVDTYFTKDVAYTDYHGKTNDTGIYMYYDSNALSSSELELYPQAPTNQGVGLFTVITDYVDKDAGEKLGFLVEIPILSEDPTIRVYNGMAKFNKIVEGDDTIRSCLLLYEPPKNAIKIDQTRILDMAVSGSYGFGYYELNFTASQNGYGVAFYDVNTLDLVLTYITPITSGTQAHTKYYKVVEERFGGGYNIVLQLSNTANNFMNFDVSLSPKISLNMLFNSDVDVQLLNPLPPTFTFISKTPNKITFTLKNENAVTSNVYYEIGDSTPDYFISLEPGETSEQITIDLLDELTTYTLYYRSYAYSRYSAAGSHTFTTLAYIGVTTAPTLGRVSCISSGGVQTTVMNIKNNHITQVEMFINGSNFGVWNAGETKNVDVESTTDSPPINYSFSVIAKGDYADYSTEVNKSGTLLLCSAAT